MGNAHDEWYAAHCRRQLAKPNPMQICTDCGRDYPEDMTECPFCEVSRVTGEPPQSKEEVKLLKDEVKRFFSCIVAEKKKTEAPTFRHKALNLMCDGNDMPYWNMANAITLLTDHADWRGVLAFNSFTMSRVLLRTIPGQKAGEFPRQLEDDDYSAARAWFNRNGFPRATSEIIHTAMRKVCRDWTYGPLRDYLDGLVWDGEPRLTSWLTTYCGVDSNEYTSEVGLRWCISAVARGYKPGCKADHMLVMEGRRDAASHPP